MLGAAAFTKLIGYLSVAMAVGGLSYQYNKRFLEWLRFQSLGTRDYIVERLSQMFIDLAPQRILLFMFLGSVGMGMLTFLLLLPQWFPGLVLGAVVTVIGWKAPRPVV